LLDQRIEQFRSAGPKNSESGSRQPDEIMPAIQRVCGQSPVSAPEYLSKPAGDGESERAGSLAVLKGTPNSARMTQQVPSESETTGSISVPELFLDLSQETQSPGSAGSSKESVHRGAEVSIGSSPVQVLMRAVAWIVVALCIFSLTILGVRRWQRQRGLLPTTNSRSRVLETLSLGPGRTVSLIELAGFKALVASDAGGIRSLVLTPVSFHDEFTHIEESTSQRIPVTTQS
jgi:flagellar biogenesis protein FliO